MRGVRRFQQRLIEPLDRIDERFTRFGSVGNIANRLTDDGANNVSESVGIDPAPLQTCRQLSRPLLIARSSSGLGGDTLFVDVGSACGAPFDGAQQLSENLAQVIGAAAAGPDALRAAPKMDLRLTLVATAQGAKSGASMDPYSIELDAHAVRHAWLTTLSEEEAP